LLSLWRAPVGTSQQALRKEQQDVALVAGSRDREEREAYYRLSSPATYWGRDALGYSFLKRTALRPSPRPASTPTRLQERMMLALLPAFATPRPANRGVATHTYGRRLVLCTSYPRREDGSERVPSISLRVREAAQMGRELSLQPVLATYPFQPLSYTVRTGWFLFTSCREEKNSQGGWVYRRKS
jgi:hypothetical protein